MKKTIIISGFPGIGKTYAYNKLKWEGYDVLDSDSSNFSWLPGKINEERNTDFPKNYIEHINENIGKVDYIFVSSHKVVRDALENNGIRYVSVFPRLKYKDLYIERYINRGNTEDFIKIVESQWDNWIKEMMEITTNCTRITVEEEYLYDVIKKMDPIWRKSDIDE